MLLGAEPTAFPVYGPPQLAPVYGPPLPPARKPAPVRRPAAPAPASSSSSSSGWRSWPWGKILLAVGVAGAAFWFMRGGKRKRVRNPADEDEDDDQGEEEARRFYKKFHWGRSAKKSRRVRVSSLPRHLVKLGTLEAVTYSAKKGAEKLADYIHHFGEGGTKKPTLAAEPSSRRLHIVGGGYDVQEAGIVG